jgi:DNA-binding HxlR family transcriptional regulator
MHSARPKEPCADRCPALIREALDLISAKWTVPIFFALEDAATPLRYAELERRLQPITPKELAKHLRQLETAGLVERRVHPTVPPSVDYALTELGRSLHPSFAGLADWAARFGEIVAENRQRSERAAPLRLIKPAYRIG